MSDTPDPSPAEQCQVRNSDPAHQRLADQARARQCNREYRAQAGQCSFSAFSARWRAGRDSLRSPPRRQCVCDDEDIRRLCESWVDRRRRADPVMAREGAQAHRFTSVGLITASGRYQRESTPVSERHRSAKRSHNHGGVVTAHDQPMTHWLLMR
jgi:hypothetical protein